MMQSCSSSTKIRMESQIACPRKKRRKPLCLLAAINIYQNLLTHEKGRQASKKMGEIYSGVHPGGWYGKWNIEEIFDQFVDVIFETFSWLFVDDGLPSPNVSACHHRRK